MKKLISLSFIVFALIMSTNVGAQRYLKTEENSRIIIHDEKDDYRNMLSHMLHENDIDLIAQQITLLQSVAKREFPNVDEERLNILTKVFAQKELPEILQKYMLPIFRENVATKDIETWTKVIHDENYITINNNIAKAQKNCANLVDEQKNIIAEGKKVKVKAKCSKNYLTTVKNYLNSVKGQAKMTEQDAKLNAYMNNQYPITLANALMEAGITESELNQLITFYSLPAYSKILQAKEEALKHTSDFAPIIRDLYINWTKQQLK